MTAAPTRSRRELSRFLKFTVVGAIGFVVDFTTFNILISLIGLNSNIAQILSFSAAIVSNFIFNRFWTYPDSRNKPIQRQATQFGLVSVIGLLIRTPVFAFVEGPSQQFAELLLAWLGVGATFPIDATALGSNIALMVAVVVVLFWNFFINRFWTYSDIE